MKNHAIPLIGCASAKKTFGEQNIFSVFKTLKPPDSIFSKQKKLRAEMLDQ